MDPERERLLRDAQEKKAAALCFECGGEIYEYEDFYLLSGRCYCPDCVEDALRSF